VGVPLSEEERGNIQALQDKTSEVYINKSWELGVRLTLYRFLVVMVY